MNGHQPVPPAPLPCTGVNGTTVYYVDYARPEAPGLPWYFLVHRTTTPNETDHWFELTLEPFNDRLRSATMHTNNKAWYHKAGIPEAVLRYARKVTGLPIVSSSNKNGDEEYRTPEATKVWERLRPDANYDPGDDRYTLP